MAGKPMNNFMRGGLKDGFVKMSPYGKAVPDAAKKKADGIKAAMMKGEFAIFKGPLKDNTGKEVIATGTTLQADRPGARTDELPRRGRHREDLEVG